MIPYTQEQSSLLPPCHDLAPRFNSDPNTIPPISILQDMPNSEDNLDEANIQAIYHHIRRWCIGHQSNPLFCQSNWPFSSLYPLLLLQPLSVAQATQIEGKDEYD
ncbi:hypothetical protein SERLA73DRAFT_68168 [Serpula lacrymans var. lacrymans S7.3]|uniref:Uncharacterized protein n=1 Tax=Serpula lacrymans var. lacrymans (strain S7.3) TaxID=936435 RepID=F8PHA1_SERL3|nr:hypothetical protein SERLA73DRAFT_68168 [Serpula lacrymans var. lacrymans S7.3]